MNLKAEYVKNAAAMAVMSLSLLVSAPCHGAWQGAASAPGIEIIGANLNTGALSRGIYSFNTANAEFTPLVSKVEVNGGGMYANGKYYAHTYDYDANYKLTKSQWLRYDPDVWQLEAAVDCPLSDYTYIAFDRTWDPSTGKAYALSSDRTGATAELSVTDLATGRNTLIAGFSADRNMICIAADGAGHLYTLDTSGKLYSVNPANAEVTLIGDTHIMDDYVTDYSQSMVYDPASGRLYWSEFHTEGMTFAPKGALYCIDPSTAATYKVYDLPAKAEMVGLYIPEQGIAAAPAAPALLKVSPKSAGAMQVRFEFTAPKASNDGAPLPAATPLSFEIAVNGETIDILDDILPGAKVQTSYYTLTQGVNVVKVRAENAAGAGKVAAAKFFTGWDVPAAPAPVAVTAVGFDAQLSWAQPSVGAQGGALRGTLTYDVTRMPDQVKVASAITATSYKDVVKTPGYYWYEVSARTTDGGGPAAESRGAALGEFSVPYSEDFSNPLNAKLYTVFDSNNDGRTWAYYPTDSNMRYEYSVGNAADDMVVTPAIALSAAKAYTLEFTLAKYLNSYNEKVEVWMGDALDPASMQYLGIINTEIAVEPKPFSFVVAPAHDGAHYFGFKAVSGKNQMFIYLDNIKVTECGSSAMPSAVADFKASATGASRSDVAISLVAPSRTLAGNPLGAIEKITLLKDGSEVPLHTFEAPAAGSTLRFTDSNVAVGHHTYTAQVYCASGISQNATATVFAGIDLPLPATEVKMEYADGAVTLTWQGPEAGVKGGSLEGLLEYEVVRMVNMAPDATFTVAGTESALTDSYTTDTQAYLYYTVVARTPAGSAKGADSQGEVIGLPFFAPYEESFAGAVPATNPWFISPVSGRKPGWGIVKQGNNMDPTPKPYDNDGGMAEFDGYHLGSDVSRLVTPRLFLNNLGNPKLTFAFYQYAGNTWSGETGPEYVKERMQVEISLDGGAWIEIPGAAYTLYAKKTGWVLVNVPLDKYTECTYANIAFKGISGNTYNMYVDALSLTGDINNGIDTHRSDTLLISAGDGAITWSGLRSGATLRIASIDGRTVYTSTAPSGICTLQAGIYVVAGRKIMVK